MTDKENARPGDSRNNGRKADKPPRKYQSRASKATADYPPVTLEEAQRALYCIPADCSEEEWSKAGMAFSAEFPNRLDIFDRWSATATISGKYNSTDLKSRWNNRWTRHQGIGIGSLFEIAKTYGYQPNRSTAPLSPEAQARAEQERAKRQAETQRKAEEAAAKAVHGAQRAAAEHQKAPPVPPSHGYPVRKKLNVEILNAWVLSLKHFSKFFLLHRHHLYCFLSILLQ